MQTVSIVILNIIHFTMSNIVQTYFKSMNSKSQVLEFRRFASNIQTNIQLLGN